MSSKTCDVNAGFTLAMQAVRLAGEKLALKYRRQLRWLKKQAPKKEKIDVYELLKNYILE